tara:strand:- start:13023 stop:13205 length:183 start_codon:yes stop_codon:yes gene_type:complete
LGGFPGLNLGVKCIGFFGPKNAASMSLLVGERGEDKHGAFEVLSTIKLRITEDRIVNAKR